MVIDGFVSAMSPGTAVISASVSLPVAGDYSGYNPSCATLQVNGTFSGKSTATIGDSTPIIAGLNPSDWTAGTTSSVTITGQNFGTNAPALSFSPGSGISYTLSSYNDTQIIANITVASGTPTESVSVYVTSNGYSGQPFSSGGDGQPAKSTGANAQVHAPMSTKEVTVVGWINANAISLPTGENAALQSALNGSTSTCATLVSLWAAALPADLATAADAAYANAWLLKHSGNPAPPSTITRSYMQSSFNYRVFNDYGGPGGAYAIGSTPDPCGSGLIPNWSTHGQPSQYNGATGTALSGNSYQLAEGRVGQIGQLVSYTINDRTVPWIWSLIEFTPSGAPSYMYISMFPTFSIYIGGTLSTTIPQSSVAAFVAKDDTYEFTPSEAY